MTTTTTTTTINHDRISMASRNKVSEVAYRALDAIQNEQPEIQVFAATVLFAAICQRLMVSPSDLHSKALRMLNPEPFDRSGNERYRALVDYAGGVLIDQPATA